MDGPRDYHTRSKPDKDKISYDIAYMWNLKIFQMIHIKLYTRNAFMKKQTWLSKGKGEGG